MLGLGLAAYFGYHAVNGSRGLFAWREVDAKLEATRQDLESLRAERQALEGRVERLRHDSLDPDLIDELARKELSLVEPLGRDHLARWQECLQVASLRLFGPVREWLACGLVA